ncbi:MAG: hypothetical protein ACU85V_04665 [Gammaproteobacteria bacterium]
MIPLSARTRALVEACFPAAAVDDVAALLEHDCADALPGCAGHDPARMERIRFAVLKLSGGDETRLLHGLELARTDWRDLLVAAGFEHALDAHGRWASTVLGDGPG